MNSYKSNGYMLVKGLYSPNELNVGLAKNNKLSSDELTTGKVIKLNAGGLLLFSANMIHRGLYGKNRLALDIIFCENAPQLTAFINAANTPNSAIANKTDNPQVFFNPL